MADLTMGFELRIGVDIGGTFTDFVYVDPTARTLERFKLLSTPQDPASAVLDGLEKIFAKSGSAIACTVVHGSTVATNALLERKGAVTALITTRGFRDVLHIGRQNRPDLYDLSPHLPVPLVTEDLRFELDERVDSRGDILVPLKLDDLRATVTRMQTQSAPPIESVAVCFLFSFLHPLHERTCAEELRRAGFFVSASSEVLPEFREYERTSTTVVNAYVSPVQSRYLDRLQGEIVRQSATDKAHIRLQVMQSNGGMISPQEAGRNGARCILSGPAGGLIAAQELGRSAWSHAQIHALSPRFLQIWGGSEKASRLITFDMGGTSTDVSLIDGSPQVTTETVIGGCPIGLPVLDIHTIGAGGGSIASIDLGGALKVGPQSAGAYPGPACYARTDPSQSVFTVTDANLLLGRLPADDFLDGEIPLDTERSLFAAALLAARLKLTPYELAQGVVDVANAHMQHALKVISVERGHDPRSFTLLSFGGAGGLHATELASSLDIPRVLVPRLASTFSALGMIAADVIKDYSQTVMLPSTTPLLDLDQQFAPMIQRGRQELLDEGLTVDQILPEPALDMRYRGQSYELTIPYTPDFVARFHASHRERYGYARLEAVVEIVNLRLKAVGKVPSPVSESVTNRGHITDLPVPQYRSVFIGGHRQEIPTYHASSLLPGMQVEGPTLIVCPDTTVLVGFGWLMQVGLGMDILMVNGYAN